MKKFSNTEYRSVWSAFEEKFLFTPSVDSSLWPGILEPTPSFTISLTESDYGVHPDESIIRRFLADSFIQLTGNNKIYYILDWCHTCYSEADIKDDNIWVYPDGDYAICMNKDMSLGSFGHPWEQTICFFGNALIKITRNKLPKEFSRVLRENL